MKLNQLDNNMLDQSRSFNFCTTMLLFSLFSLLFKEKKGVKKGQ